MWEVFLIISIVVLLLSAIVPFLINAKRIKNKEKKVRLFHFWLAGVFLAAMVMFFPVHLVGEEMSLLGGGRAFLLSLFNAVQIFTMGTEFEIVEASMIHASSGIGLIYQIWAAILFLLAPVFSFGVVLSLFKNFSAYLRYLRFYFNDAYIFSELNEKSLVLAEDLLQENSAAVIIFTDVFEDEEEKSYELVLRAQKMGAICFKKDILAVNFKRHSSESNIFFFTIGENKTENLNQALKIIETYKMCKNINLYVFSTNIESELLLTSVDKGFIKVRRINEVRSLINRELYANGQMLFKQAISDETGVKHISAVVIGMGLHGTEMVKALAWFGQMDGYQIEIHAFDKDPLAEEKFTALAPELMSPNYNGVFVEGEAQYSITIHSGLDTDSVSFANAISALERASYVFVALGDDEMNIKTAVNLRMLFERKKMHPMIQAIVYNTQECRALEGIKNYRGQAYDIAFIGDLESSFKKDVIIDSALEQEALQRHLKWGTEEEFWTYEYNYRSSMASAIHMQARIACGIPGANKAEEDLTEEERACIETLEHRRWNAYMRAEGYVYSGSNHKESRNDLAKMHHNLVDFSSLSEEDKRKDSKVGTV